MLLGGVSFLAMGGGGAFGAGLLLEEGQAVLVREIFEKGLIREGEAGAGGFDDAGAEFGFGEAVLEGGAPEGGSPVGGPWFEMEPGLRGSGGGGVGEGAAPGPVGGGLDQVGADRVAFDIGEDGGEIAGFKGTGVEAILPEVTGLGAADVDVAGVVVVGEADGAGERGGGGGRGDDVDVVGHEAVAEDLDLVSGRIFLEESEVEGAVGIGEEDGLAVVAALGDVMGAVGDDDAGASGHM